MDIAHIPFHAFSAPHAVPDWIRALAEVEIIPGLDAATNDTKA